jgi:hypothetical protein
MEHNGQEQKGMVPRGCPAEGWDPVPLFLRRIQNAEPSKRYKTRFGVQYSMFVFRCAKSHAWNEKNLQIWELLHTF